MKEDRVELGASDILQFVGSQLSDLDEDLRLIEGAILTAAAGGSASRRVLQNLDRSLQVIQDLSRLCTEVSHTVEAGRIEARQVSTHLRLGHLKAQLLGSSLNVPAQTVEPDFFD